MSSQNQKKTNWQPMIIGLLVILVLLQGLLLISYHLNQSESESKKLGPKIAVPEINTQSAATPATAPHTARSPFARSSDPFLNDAFEMMQSMQQNMDKMFGAAMTYGPSIAQSWSQMNEFDFMPALDLEELEDMYLVRCDLPGLDKNKIDVKVQNNVLTIQGVRETGSEKKDNQKGFYSMERSYGTFARTLALPGPVDETQVKAEYTDGVLRIELPKAIAQKSKKVSID